MPIAPRPAARRLGAAAAVLALVTAAAAGAADGVPSRAPDATIDLATREGVRALGAEWRYGDARVVEVPFRAVGPDRKPTGAPNRTYDVLPHAGAADFDDSAWQVIDPTTLAERRAGGKVSFNWYRLRATLPEAVAGVPVAGATVVFEIVVDDYAEVWVNGALPRDLGQSGGTVVAGFNVPNRLVVARAAHPGQQIQLAVFGINGPISAAPENYIWVRSAKLHVYAPRAAADTATTDSARFGRIRRFDPRFDALVSRDARLETVASGFTWVEGPAWDRRTGALLFTDIPANRVMRWHPRAGVTVFLEPSGYTGTERFAGREPGANGLAFDRDGRLVLAEHGDRRIARLERDGRKATLADRWHGMRLNSPNDVLVTGRGDLYFTDPPFGLPRAFDDPAKEIAHSGVYRVAGDTEPTLLTAELRAPNGIALSPDERTLYVSNADAAHPVWTAYDLRPDGTLGPGRVLYDASAWARLRPGLPDGMKVDRAGNLFGAGPGGVYVFAPDGTLLGIIETGVATSNVGWGGDGTELYITASTAVYRVATSTRGW